jgi:hypothetical protein
LPAVPADPFALSGTLRDRRKGNRCVLYSIGPDGIDDGGTPALNTNPNQTSRSRYLVRPDSRGDVVAGTNTE